MVGGTAEGAGWSYGASLAKAENALSRGFKPFDVFIAEVRQAADRLNDGEQRE